MKKQDVPEIGHDPDSWTICVMCGKMILYKDVIKTEYSEQGNRHYFFCTEDHRIQWESTFKEEEQTVI